MSNLIWSNSKRIASLVSMPKIGTMHRWKLHKAVRGGVCSSSEDEIGIVVKRVKHLMDCVVKERIKKPETCQLNSKLH